MPQAEEVTQDIFIAYFHVLVFSSICFSWILQAAVDAEGTEYSVADTPVERSRKQLRKCMRAAWIESVMSVAIRTFLCGAVNNEMLEVKQELAHSKVL